MDGRYGIRMTMGRARSMMIAIMIISWSFGQNDHNLIKQRFQDKASEMLGSLDLTWGQVPHHPINRTSRDPEDLLGDWNAEYMAMNMLITSGTDQTAPNFNQRMGRQPASGSIDVSGALSGQMTYMMAMADSGATMVMLGNNPMTDDYYGDSEDIILPNFQLIYMYEEGEGEIFMFIGTDTLAGDSIQGVWGSEDASDHITLDSTSLMVTIDDLNLTGLLDSSTITLSGSLVPESIDIIAGEPFSITVETEGPDYSDGFVMRFLEDGTGLQMEENYDYDYWDNYDSLLIEIDTLEFDWFANDDSVTIISMEYDDYYDEPTGNLDTMTLGYSVVGDTLYMGESFDPCLEDYYYYEDCDSYYEDISAALMIDDIQSVMVEESIVLSSMSPLTISKDQITPARMSLGQNYPNPFNPVTTLVYELSEDALVSMSVHDLSGRLVKDLISEQQSAGHRTIKWNATNNSGQPVSAGVYLYKIQIGDMMQTKKMVLLK
jgi:hypothetical protein